MTLAGHPKLQDLNVQKKYLQKKLFQQQITERYYTMNCNRLTWQFSNKNVITSMMIVLVFKTLTSEETVRLFSIFFLVPCCWSVITQFHRPIYDSFCPILGQTEIQSRHILTLSPIVCKAQTILGLRGRIFETFLQLFKVT